MEEVKFENRIGIDDLRDVIKQDREILRTEPVYGIEVEYVSSLGYSEVEAIIGYAVDKILSLGNPDLEVMQFITCVAYATMATNVDFGSDISEAYDIYTSLRLDEMLSLNTTGGQYQHVKEAVIDEVRRELGKQNDPIVQAAEKLSSLLGEIGNKIGDLFGDLSKDDLGKLLSAVTETGKIDAEELMRVYLSENAKKDTDDTGTVM